MHISNGPLTSRSSDAGPLLSETSGGGMACIYGANNGINPNNAYGKVFGKEATGGSPGSRGIVKSRGHGDVMYVPVGDVSLNNAQGVCVAGG